MRRRFEALLHGLAEPLGLERSVLVHGERLRREHHVVAATLQRAADDLLGAVDLRGVDEVDAEVEGAVHDRDRLGLGRAVRLTEPAVTTAAQPGDRHLEAGAPQRDLLHHDDAPHRPHDQAA